MKNSFKNIFLFAATMTLATAAFAETEVGPDDAIAMVKKAVADIKKNGKAKAFADFGNVNNTQFHNGDLYVSVLDMNGVMLHGNNPKLIGRDLLDMKDVNGKFITKSMLEVANGKGHGWVEYTWPNPVTHVMAPKSSYVEKVDDVMVVTGIYRK